MHNVTSKPGQQSEAQRLSFARRVWNVLKSPVGEKVPWPERLAGTRTGVRFSRGPRKNGKRGAPHGVALLTVLVALALMSAVVTDLSQNEMVRYKLAIHDRDAMRAQALAESGVNVARLLLAVQAALQPMLTQVVQMGIPLPSQTVWELIPLESDLMRGMISGELQSALGLDVSGQVEGRREAMAQAKEDMMADWDAEKEGAGNGPFFPPEGGFGGFDGNFNVEIQDEERKAVSLRGWANANDRFVIGQKLYTLFQPERFDFLFEDRDSYGDLTNRYELVANIYDWMDTNEDVTDGRAEPALWGRFGSGSEDALYSSFDDVEPKNEYFDSHRELRMVRGMDDAKMKAFGDSISIYGESKVNILSAPAQSIETLIRICAVNPADPLLFDPEWMRLTVGTWMSCKSMGGMIPGGCTASPDGFVAYLQSGLGTNGTPLVIDDQRCKDNLGMESKNFTVKSSGVVGGVTRTVTLVVRVHGAIEERYFYSIVGQ